MSITRVVAITGCDSGLGWALAARLAREGIITIAGMYHGTATEAAEALRRLRVHPCKLDVTNPDSVISFRDYVYGVLNLNQSYRLHAVVNNAGVMTIGNFEWQTSTMIHNMINVNLLGAMDIATAFLPELRESAAENTSTVKPRLINVASHCGFQALPGFAAYGASKAGVIAWTKALRFEHRNQGLAVLAFVPGGFFASSSILANQIANGAEMVENLDEEQTTLYERQITTLSNYLAAASGQRIAKYDALTDENIIETFMEALTHDDPKALYKVDSWRYKFYFNLLKLPLPEIAERFLIKRFLNFPE